MSSIRHFVDEAIKKMELDEFLSTDLERAGYGGVDVTNTPLGTRLTIYAMKPGIVIGRRGESIRELTKILEDRFGVNNPQIAVAEVEVPELNPYIMASRIASALQRGIHYRRSGYWALNRIIEAGASGAEITIRGKITSRRARYEKFKAGYLPKAGDPSIRNLLSAVVHVKVKPGLCGVNVKIMPPDVRFPDKVELVSTPTSEEVSTPTSEEVSTPTSEEVSTPTSEEVSTPTSEEVSTPTSEEVSTKPIEEVVDVEEEQSGEAIEEVEETNEQVEPEAVRGASNADTKNE